MDICLSHPCPGDPLSQGMAPPWSHPAGLPHKTSIINKRGLGKRLSLIPCVVSAVLSKLREPWFYSILNMMIKNGLCWMFPSIKQLIGKKKKFQKFFEYSEENTCHGQELQLCLCCQVHRSRGIIPSSNLGVIFFLEKKIKQGDFHKMQGEHTYLSYSGKLTALE